MSSVQSNKPLPTNPEQVRGAIAGATRATGVDFRYLLAQARIESDLDPAARASRSSGAGLYQFLGSTWLDTLDRHAQEHGLGWVSDAIERNGARSQVRDPDLRARIMNLRFDPAVSSVMAAELAIDNSKGLQSTLGRAPDATELYLAHFLGGDGAARFLTALEAGPTRSAASLFPQAAEANRAIFYSRDGSPRSLGEVMGLLRDRMERASGDETGWSAPDGSWAQGPGGAAPAAPPTLPGWSREGPMRAPMSELLRTTLIATQSPAGAGADQVRAAYSRLKAFGL